MCVALSLIGAISLEYEIQKRKRILFGQLCRLDTYFAVKRLFLYRLTSKYIFNDIDHSFIYDVFQFFAKYNLEHLIVDFVNTGNFPAKHSWKRILNSKIKDQTHQDFASQIADEGLQLFLTFHQEVKPCMF